ncbi:MAG: START-like domain-containing protein [Dysgonamonadaceae bacterium]|nr:START-like domain-containing protein [Dysgonamonadaceae bacterium]MDD4727221.1 START-like domain-containing protein [Dysgonamonadaceae bacterium]
MEKEKYNIEFVLGNASQQSLWRMLTEPTALEEWFADKVNLEDEIFYTFTWNNKTTSAEMVLKKPISQVRYCWLTEDKSSSYFEFRLHKMALTGDIALEITDFACSSDKDDAVFLWENQIDELKRKLGI